jgi:hypothetical protein
VNRLWVRNLLGITVITGSLAANCLAVLFSQWSIYQHSVTPDHVVPRGSTASMSGQTWRLGSVQRITKLPDRAGRPPIPPGATLMAVVIERSIGTNRLLCTGVLTDGRQRWRDQSSSLVVYPLVPGATQFCSKPGPLQFDFLLPRNVNPSAIDLTDGNGAIGLRFEI